MSDRIEAVRKKTSLVLAAEVRESELACRMIDAAHEATGSSIRRPANLTAEEALNVLDPIDRAMWRAVAQTALSYIQECLKNAQRPS